LVDRLLTLARADAGQRLALCPVPLRPLLEEAYRQARLLATGQEVVLEATEDVTVLANRDVLKQLVLIGPQAVVDTLRRAGYFNRVGQDHRRGGCETEWLRVH